MYYSAKFGSGIFNIMDTGRLRDNGNNIAWFTYYVHFDVHGALGRYIHNLNLFF